MKDDGLDGDVRECQPESELPKSASAEKNTLPQSMKTVEDMTAKVIYLIV